MPELEWPFHYLLKLLPLHEIRDFQSLSECVPSGSQEAVRGDAHHRQDIAQRTYPGMPGIKKEGSVRIFIQTVFLHL